MSFRCYIPTLCRFDLSYFGKTFSVYGELNHSYLCLKETCEVSADCLDGLICLEEKCKPCFNSGQCPNGQNCEDGSCNEPPPECIESSDCQLVTNLILSNYTINSFPLFFLSL